MTDDGCHLLTDLVVWDMKVDFVWFINIKYVTLLITGVSSHNFYSLK